MKWKNARRSENVEDRRGGGGGPRGLAMKGGMGGLAVIVIALLMGKGDLGSMLTQILSGAGQSQGVQAPERPLTEEEQKAGEFVKAVLGYTEDVWNDIYADGARAHRGATPNYQEPKLVLFAEQVASACGNQSSAVGPFYCPGDNQVYIDLEFFAQLATRFGAPGDFAQAYVIAHEVGHHVQNLLGVSRMVHEKKARVSEEEYNQLSVRLELQADYFAGCWAHHAEQRYQILERGDLDEGLKAAFAVGDDTIQKRSRGYVVPESFTHGTSEQRVRWFRLGFKSGDPAANDPFDVDYRDL